ncbi:hypothetical protein [Nonomuraea rubra]|uniref:hypothetical protein n=1 Tax=Nonomuraea rubra TaxID=46180 RepID=UPI0031E60AAF
MTSSVRLDDRRSKQPRSDSAEDIALTVSQHRRLVAAAQVVHDLGGHRVWLLL